MYRLEALQRCPGALSISICIVLSTLGRRERVKLMAKRYCASKAESALAEGANQASRSTICKVRPIRNMTEAWHVSVDFIVRMC